MSPLDLDKFEIEDQSAPGRDIVHLRRPVSPFCRDGHLVPVPLMHSRKGDLPPHYKVADKEEGRKRIILCRIEYSAVY